MNDERLCTNCREPLPRGATWCEKCGADAGDIFDGKIKKERRPREWARPVAVLLIVLGAAFAAWTWWESKAASRAYEEAAKSAPVRVVRQRPGGSSRAPGAKLSRAEATITLRRHLASRATDAIKPDCLAISSKGFRNGAYDFDVLDRCASARLGRWHVNGASGAVAQ